MYKKFILTLTLGTLLTIAAATQAVETITDDFNTPHDYLKEGVAGTIWDGFLAPPATNSVIDANITNTPSPLDANVGALYVASSNSRYEAWPGFPDPNIPLLFVDVVGDFNVIVKVVDFCGCWGSPRTEHNSGGITVRVPDLDVAGPGEDAVTIEYFPTWDADTWRNIDDNVETEYPIHGEADCSVADWYLRLQRIGNTIYPACGRPDPITGNMIWSTSGGGSVLRDDMAASPYLQVGLFQSTYSPNFAWISFDDFQITGTKAPHPKAYAPFPENNATEVLADVTLKWKSGDDVKPVGGHKLYIDTDYNKVLNRTTTVHIVNDPCYPSGGLLLNTLYYWCVDEVKNDESVVPGDIWRFTITPSKAKEPVPGDGEANISTTIANLKWTPGVYTEEQDFFFGTDEAAVEAMTVPTQGGLAGDANSVNTPGLPLDKGKNYYWRIDSNCGSYGVVKGDVWSFKTKYPVEICDDFETSHNYFIGTEGTMWDGIEGLETALEINANDSNTGRLYVNTAGSTWNDNDKGFLLYKTMPGTFAATVQLYDFLGMPTGTGYVDGQPGLMVRISNVNAGGEGEDWISLGVYNPQWGSGLRITETDDGVTSDWLALPGEFDAEKYFQIQREESALNILKSFDGIEWTACPGASPHIRADFEGQALQIGICNNAGTASWAVFDDFCIGRDRFAKAFAPYPPNGGVLDPMVPVVSWAPGDDAVGHHVYFSADFDDVNERKPAADKGTTVDGPDASGRFSYDLSAETLAIGQIYYWCIDEINVPDPCSPWLGDVWEFVVQDYTNIDTFETYNSTGKSTPIPADSLWCVWVDGLSAFKMVPPIPGTSGSHVQLNIDTYDGKTTYAHYVPDDEDIALTGSKSMKYYYDNGGSVRWNVDLYNLTPDFAYIYIPNPLKYVSEAYAAIDTAAAPTSGAGTCSLNMKRNWSGYKLLRVPFYGDPNNTINNAAMYVGIEDGTGRYVYLSHPDATSLQNPWWQDWYVPLLAFKAADPLLDLTNIAKIYIGFGNRANPTLNPGGSGVVFFDDLQLLAYGICIPGSVVGDLDDDCTVNYSDLEILTDFWLAETGTISASDNFSYVKNFKTEGTGGTIWDGYITPYEPNLITLQANGTTLKIESTYTRWGPGLASELGILLYKNVSGSFTATVKVVDVNHTDPNEQTDSGGLMVRVADVSAAGEGEDFVSLDVFPGWDVGTLIRDVNDGVRSERGQTYDTIEPQWLKLTYYAPTGDFYCMYSTDGVIFTPFDNAYPLSRPDIANVDIQVGLAHNTWEDYTDFAIFDDFEINSIAPLADLYIDGKIEFKDIAILGNNWLVGPVLLGD